MTLFGDGAFEVVINFSGAIREFQPNLTGVLISRGVKHSEREAKAMCARVRARTHTHTHAHTHTHTHAHKHEDKKPAICKPNGEASEKNKPDCTLISLTSSLQNCEQINSAG